MSEICDKISKQRQKASRSRYPPGCTVLECLFEANRPVARIVQVPVDSAATAATAQDSSSLRERPSSDSLPRVTSQCEDGQEKTRDSIDCSQKPSIDKLVLKIIQPADFAKRTISDQKARVSSDRALSERGVSCRKTKPEVIHYSCPACKPARPERADLKIDISRCPEMKDPLSQITRKNSLDSFEVSSLKKPLSKYKKRICSASYQPVRPATKDVCSDFFRTKKSSTSDIKVSPIEICVQKCLDDQRFQRLASKQRTEVTQIESAKLDKVAPCQKSAIASLIPEKAFEKTLHLPRAQDLLDRYKKYIPAYQLERYENCRSKRNGLQDECIPPLLRSILKELEQQRTLDKCTKRERNVDQSDQNGTSESTNQDQTKILLYI